MMALLTMTPAIVAGLQRVDDYRIKTNSSTASSPVDDETALTQGSEKPDAKQNEIHEGRKNEAIHEADVSGYQITSRRSSSTEPSLQNPESGNPISHLQIISLSHQLKALNATPCHLDVLLRGSYVYVAPPPPKPEQTSEYKALMARLRRDAEAREYTQLTNPLPPSERYSKNLPTTSPAFAFASTEAYIEASPDDEITYADVNRQLTLILNVLISIVACSAALWMVSKWWSTPARLALSMGGSLVVAVAEVGVYLGYIRKVKEAIKEEKGVKEVKEVVQSWLVRPCEEHTSQIENKEELALLNDKGEDDVVRRRRKKTTDK